MIEKTFKLTKTNEKIIERVIINEHLHYMHAIFPQYEGLPLHQSNATVYMSVLRGTLSIRLNDEETKTYSSMNVLEIPFDTKMNVRNEHVEPLEIIIFKTPAPGSYYNKA
ncbi:MAG: cupin domain-containing protein [Bacilli bacterium]